ncbi:NAD(P)-dependent oxidoreductase [Thermopetrobacter sp. TC1]|uniref:NAD-dependent epimerase/dehydratase family protein n=1 Tax=Thermopetrobacter sp. TC1 TaxID=1495045 RepID=UPI00068C678F|nr:NAD-dependent epimerase/dehydratase family protein [Thermopetrobacter sp. TC1]
MSRKTCIALTGATGFVGSHVLAALLKQHHPLRLLVRNPQKLRLPQEAKGRLEIITGDLTDKDALRRLVDGADAVIHIAGAVAAARPADFFRINTEAAVSLAECAESSGVRRFVHVSSLAAREPHLSAYAASKAESERALIALARRDDDAMRIAIVRPPAVYGPGDPATLGLIDQLSRKRALLPGHENMRFSLIHAADLAEALVRIATDEAERIVQGEILEVDDGRPGGYTWPDIAAIVSDVMRRPVRVIHLPKGLVALAGQAASLYARLTGRAVILSPGKVRELYHHDWLARSPKVQDRLDWTARRQFAEGFAETLSWYCAEGWLPANRLPAHLRKTSAADHH